MRTARRHKSEERGTKGHAIVELAFMVPWLFFLFVGVFDLGFYSYALIATENAARSAALYTSSSTPSANDKDAACCFALRELQGMGNVTGPPFNAFRCSCADLGAVSNANPVAVRAELLDQTTNPPSLDGSQSSRVTVQYRTVQLIPIPGLLADQMTMTRAVEVRLRNF